IRRLAYLQKVRDGEVKATPLLPGALKTYGDIKLNFADTLGEKLSIGLPAVDPALQKSINSIFPNLDESYSIALLDITPGRPVRYAKRKENVGFQPGSVGKLAVIVALFDQLAKRYPDSFEKRIELLKNTTVKAGSWAVPNEHVVPFYVPETGQYYKRLVLESDSLSLFEWADHMLSVSSNAAASVVWREVLLMSAFGEEYPVSKERADVYIKSTPKGQLSLKAIALVNDPLREMGITEDEWRLGSFFTRGATNIVPRSGGSIGTPVGLMKFLIAMESGKIIDEESSLEIKRLMYMTDKRIRYAAAGVLNNAAVYFKSGSLYSCKAEEGFTCTKYHGNVVNFMNSVAIVEHPDGTTYLVVLMSNVLKKNSSGDHYGLASQIDKI
ncbi:beta-lactamase/transpeptidase-like protein, partial [Ochromonadaceae sp. CCMP2298]